ncbi:MAG: hypothetical protein LBR39_01520 [Coriobacteriales bacterium]|jgi:predicted transcriptional regulator of viral defense system|nr:hypothetical protein [Coriobacteriales bacterium]
MAIQEYINTHQVFNIADLRSGNSLSTTNLNLLSRAVANGKLERVRKGLYVSKTGRFEGAVAEPYDVAMAAVDDAVFCCLSALQLHGVLHNTIYWTQFYTRHHLPVFSYEGQRYIPIYNKRQNIDLDRVMTLRGGSYPVTSREQTVLDCLSNVNRAAGAENLLRSVGGFAYLDVAQLLNLAASYSAGTRARLGWLLSVNKQIWKVSDTQLLKLQTSIGAGPYYFGSKPTASAAGSIAQSEAAPKTTWQPTWRLYLPTEEEEMTAWLNH